MADIWHTTEYRELVKCYWHRETEVLREKPVPVPFCTTNPINTRDIMGLNPGICGDRPATEVLKHGTVYFYNVFQNPLWKRRKNYIRKHRKVQVCTLTNGLLSSPASTKQYPQACLQTQLFTSLSSPYRTHTSVQKLVNRRHTRYFRSYKMKGLVRKGIIGFVAVEAFGYPPSSLTRMENLFWQNRQEQNKMESFSIAFPM
jgi:hypothetical protein